MATQTTTWVVETNGISCEFTDREAAECFAESNGAVVKEKQDSPLRFWAKEF